MPWGETPGSVRTSACSGPSGRTFAWAIPSNRRRSVAGSALEGPDVQHLSGAPLREIEPPDEGDVTTGVPACLVDRAEGVSLGCLPGQLDQLAPVPARPVGEGGRQLAGRQRLGRPPQALRHAGPRRGGDARPSEALQDRVGHGVEGGRRESEVGRARLAEPVDREEPALGHDDEDGARRRGMPQLEEGAVLSGSSSTTPPVVPIVAQVRATRTGGGERFESALREVCGGRIRMQVDRMRTDGIDRVRTGWSSDAGSQGPDRQPQGGGVCPLCAALRWAQADPRSAVDTEQEEPRWPSTRTWPWSAARCRR